MSFAKEDDSFGTGDLPEPYDDWQLIEPEEMAIRNEWKPGDVVEVFSESRQDWMPTQIRQVIPAKDEKQQDILVTRNKTVRRGNSNVRIASEARQKAYRLKKKKKSRMNRIKKKIMATGTLLTAIDSKKKNIKRPLEKPLKLTVLGTNTPPGTPKSGKRKIGAYNMSTIVPLSKTQKKRSSSLHGLQVGLWVLYANETSGEWLHAKIVQINEDGTIDLDIQEGVPVELIHTYPQKLGIEQKIRNNIAQMEATCARVSSASEKARQKIAERDAKYNDTIKSLERKIRKEKEKQMAKLRLDEELEQLKKQHMERKIELQNILQRELRFKAQLQTKSRKTSIKNSSRSLRRRSSINDTVNPIHTDDETSVRNLMRLIFLS